MNNNAAAKVAEVLAIIDTYEGILRQDMRNTAALKAWTKWKQVLCRLEGR